MKAHQKYNYVGRYIRIRVQASPQTLLDVNHRLKVDEEVVRHRAFKVKDFAPLPPKKQKLGPQVEIFSPHEGSSTPVGSELDYFAARTLMQKGLLTRENISQLSKWKDAEEEQVRKAEAAAAWRPPQAKNTMPLGTAAQWPGRGRKPGQRGQRGPRGGKYQNRK